MTASATLKSLTLTAFRGSTTKFKLDFEKGKKLTLIYGENGTGNPRENIAESVVPLE